MPLESYAIGKVIGKGSYGEVCLVKHRKDRKQVRFYPVFEKVLFDFVSVAYNCNPMSFNE